MRKISLLFVLITVALLSSCVDDKESATVEQIRTAKTEWLKAQAEMLQAQGEAQKILAETEKLKKKGTPQGLGDWRLDGAPRVGGFRHLWGNKKRV